MPACSSTLAVFSVVAGHSSFAAPADETIPAAQVPRRRAPRQARDGTLVRPHQVLQMLAHRLLVAQVMMGFHQAVEQRLLGRASRLLKLDGLDLAQRAWDRRAVDQHRRRPGPPRQRVRGRVTHRRQLDRAGPVEHQQQTATNHVAWRAVGLLPVPGFAQFLRQLAPAGLGMFRD